MDLEPELRAIDEAVQAKRNAELAIIFAMTAAHEAGVPWHLIRERLSGETAADRQRYEEMAGPIDYPSDTDAAAALMDEVNPDD
ncbi:hypothetical protein ACSMXN_05475 [Jatrophihabitans sp. DSM 45814]